LIEDEKLWNIVGIISKRETTVLEKTPFPMLLVHHKFHTD
jgi:hypothetical protein